MSKGCTGFKATAEEIHSETEEVNEQELKSVADGERHLLVYEPEDVYRFVRFIVTVCK